MKKNHSKFIPVQVYYRPPNNKTNSLQVHLTWPQMTHDLVMWPLTSLTYEGTFLHLWPKFDTILDGLRVIPENIGWATCMKNIGRREAESDIFQTCSESNIFRFHSKEAIQYLHYYVSESDLNKCMKSKHSPPKWLKIPVPSSILSKQLLTVKIQQFNSLRSMVGKKRVIW